MYLTALNGHVASESRSDRLGESLRTVDDEKARQGGIEGALSISACTAVDLDHQQPGAGKITRHPFLQARRRQRDKTPGGGRFRQTRAVGRRHVTFGQAHRTVDTLISI